LKTGISNGILGYQIYRAYLNSKRTDTLSPCLIWLG